MEQRNRKEKEIESNAEKEQ